MSRRAQDERDRVIGARMREVLEKRGLTYEHVFELAGERHSAADGIAADLLGALAEALQEEHHERAVCRSLAEAAAQDWPDAEGDLDAESEPLAPDALRDLLQLVSAEIPLETIESWTIDQRGHAEDWAATEHVYASDNDEVERLPMPEHVRAGRVVPS